MTKPIWFKNLMSDWFLYKSLIHEIVLLCHSLQGKHLDGIIFLEIACQSWDKDPSTLIASY